MTLRDPIKIARGLGSAKDGTGHWWMQRLTAVALLLLTPWFLWLVLGVVGADRDTVRLSLAHPLNATLLLAFLISLFWHAKLGMQVVIEDYIHGWLEILLQVLVKLAYAVAAIASVIALARIVFSA